MICARCGKSKKDNDKKLCQSCATTLNNRSVAHKQVMLNSNVRGRIAGGKAKKTLAAEKRMTQTEEEVHVPTEKEVEQFVHADIYGISREDLEKKQKEAAKADDGGSICTICYVKGCRIGPMGRG